MSTLPIQVTPTEAFEAVPGPSLPSNTQDRYTTDTTERPFADMLEGDRNERVEKQDVVHEGVVSTGETPWSAGMPVPAWMQETSELKNILTILLETPVDQAVVPEENAAAKGRVNEKPSGAWIPGFILPGGSDGNGPNKQVSKVGALAGASEEAKDISASAEDSNNLEPVGGKLKLDFSAFDAAFPEGWRELVFDQPVVATMTSAAKGTQDPTKTNESGKGKTPGLESEQTQVISTNARSSSETSEPWLPLDILQVAPLKSSEPGLSEKTSRVQHGVESAKSVMPQEKSLDPMIWRVEVRAESAAPNWGGAGEGAAKTQGATPAAVLSRLTDFQQKMTVESMVQSALPVFQGKRESITIDLNPPELGRVQVRVENNGVGVNAVLTVQDRGLGEFFQGQSDLIRKNLEEAGIRVGQLSVEVRQQMSREAGERPAATQGKSGRGAGSTSIHSLGIAESAHKEHRWGRNALSQVDMMV